MRSGEGRVAEAVGQVCQLKGGELKGNTTSITCRASTRMPDLSNGRQPKHRVKLEP